MKKNSKRIIGASLTGVMGLTSVGGVISSLEILDAKASNKAVSDVHNKIEHITYSLKNNYLGLKNVGQWQEYIKEARGLNAKLPNGSSKDKYALRIDKAEALVNAAARVNHVEKSMEVNAKVLRNVPQWEEYIRLAKLDLAKVDQSIFKDQYNSLVERAASRNKEIEAVKLNSEKLSLLATNDSKVSDLNYDYDAEVLASNVTLRDSTIKGDLKITGNNINIVNVTVEGKLIIDLGKNGVVNITGVKAKEIVMLSGKVITDGDVNVNKSTLTTAIGKANTNKGSVKVSTNGSDVDSAEKWVTASDVSYYEAAITAAQRVVDNTSATQADVDVAVKALSSATEAFNGAKKDGDKQNEEEKLKEEARKALEDAKTQAKKELDAYKKENYSKENWDILLLQKEASCIVIDMATSIDKVESARKRAIEIISRIRTIEEEGHVEVNKELEKAKEKAVSVLEDYKEDDYSISDWASIMVEKANAIVSIKMATDISEVNKAKDEAVKVIGGFKTIGQRLEEAKTQEEIDIIKDEVKLDKAKRVALAKISAYAENQGEGKEPTLEDYKNALIINVTEDNIDGINKVIAATKKEDLRTSESIQDIIYPTIALMRIDAIHYNTRAPKPTMMDFKRAGMPIYEEDLSAVYRYIMQHGRNTKAVKGDCDTLEELLAIMGPRLITDRLNALKTINNYANAKVNLTVEEYESLGVKNVTTDNLSKVNEAYTKYSSDEFELRTGNYPSVIKKIQGIVDSITGEKGEIENKVLDQNNEVIKKLYEYAEINMYFTTKTCSTALLKGVILENFGDVEDALKDHGGFDSIDKLAEIKSPTMEDIQTVIDEVQTVVDAALGDKTEYLLKYINDDLKDSNIL